MKDLQIETLKSINAQALNLSASSELRYPEVSGVYTKTLEAQLSLANLSGDSRSVPETSTVSAIDKPSPDTKSTGAKLNTYSFMTVYSNGESMKYSCTEANLGDAFRAAGKNLQEGDSLLFIKMN